MEVRRGERVKAAARRAERIGPGLTCAPGVSQEKVLSGAVKAAGRRDGRQGGCGRSQERSRREWMGNVKWSLQKSTWGRGGEVTAGDGRHLGSSYRHDGKKCKVSRKKIRCQLVRTVICIGL